jgi:hypothetical protein
LRSSASLADGDPASDRHARRYGIYDGGRSTAAERKVLPGGAHPSGSRADELTTSAVAVVRRLLAAGAHCVAAYDPSGNHKAAPSCARVAVKR